MKPTRLRTVYVLREESKAPRDARPSVHINLMASGVVTCGVTATGRSLSEARRRAEVEFSALLAFARSVKSGNGAGATEVGA